ncbi:signal protein [Kitasatospora sp. NPDC047058]|uniref:signal protein n=1 Tax=Kitasatospora sp. NPDC047058 TaxID=3155620 RepID=UPI0033F0F915
MRSVRIPVLLVTALTLLGGCSGAPDPTPATGPGALAHATGDAAASNEPTPRPTPVDVRALTPPELQNRWWSWAGSTPMERNPVADPDGRHCGEGQQEGIWLLAGTFGTTTTRHCTVPAGTPIVFPVINMYGKSSDCLVFMNDGRGSAVLDGKNLPLEELGATQIRPERVPGGPVSGDRDFNNSWACGLWVRLDGLTPGPHEIVVRGSSGSFSTGVDYWLAATEDPTAVSKAQTDRTGQPAV